MNKEFIPYQQALALKELGFNKECFGYYTGDKMHLVIRPAMSRTNIPDSYVVTAPLYQQAFRWFREKYGLTFTIKRHFNCYNIIEILEYNSIDDGNVEVELDGLYWEDFKTYQEAELECLKKLIEIVKQNNNE